MFQRPRLTMLMRDAQARFNLTSQLRLLSLRPQHKPVLNRYPAMRLFARVPRTMWISAGGAVFGVYELLSMA